MADVYAGVTLLVSVTTGTSPEIDLTGLNVRDLTFYLEWAGLVTAGAIALETADRAGYAGTWHLLDTKVGVANSEQIAQYKGVFHVIRARVSTVVVGGTVTVEVKGG